MEENSTVQLRRAAEVSADTKTVAKKAQVSQGVVTISRYVHIASTCFCQERSTYFVSCAHAHAHAHAHFARACVHTHAHLHSCTHAHMHTCTHTCTHAHMHTCTHAHIHNRIGVLHITVIEAKGVPKVDDVSMPASKKKECMIIRIGLCRRFLMMYCT